MIYGRRSSGGEHGVIMTKKDVVNFMLDACEYTSSRNLSEISILDPSGGQGVFVLSSIRRLYESSVKFKFDFRESLGNIKCVELNYEMSRTLKNNIQKELRDLGFNGNDELDQIVVNDDYLTCSLPPFDIIVGNPPYVRHENIPTNKKNTYRRLFSVFRHRSDLYIAFFQKSLKLLSTNGKLCFICPDRWLLNKFGEGLRNLLSEQYNIPMIVNLNGIDPFEETVYGYPIIILIDQLKTSEEINYWRIKDLSHLEDLLSVRNSKHFSEVVNLIVSKPRKFDPWIFENKSRFNKAACLRIEEQNFKIGIGVATGADSVFIGRNLHNEIEKELLLPIVLSRDISNGKIRWSGNYIINPYKSDSSDLIDLDQYPLVRKYLSKNSSILRKRYVVRRNPSHWYRTIDRIYPALVKMPKLLLPDITSNRIIVFDEGQYYPHHNVYYITDKSLENLKVLGAFLLSTFSLNQLASISVKMRGGYVRWQAQNLRKIWLPEIQNMPQRVKLDLITHFDKKDKQSIDDIVEHYLPGLHL